MNAIAVYFVTTYGIIVDESMIGNVLNTNYEESTSYFSYKMILYLIFFRVLPSYFIVKSKIERVSLNVSRYCHLLHYCLRLF